MTKLLVTTPNQRAYKIYRRSQDAKARREHAALHEAQAQMFDAQAAAIQMYIDENKDDMTSEDLVKAEKALDNYKLSAVTQREFVHQDSGSHGH